MEVRWLLTNRKHGGKTKSVSVLKTALKTTEGWKKNRRTIINDCKKGRDRKISELLRVKKKKRENSDSRKSRA